jgi:ketosteroid isomerase-like protein
MDMGRKENVELVRRGYEAFGTGDMETLKGLLADNIVWHVAGTGRLSGPKMGPDAVIAHFGELFTLSGGTVKVDLHDVVGGGEHVVAIQTNYGERDGKALEMRAATVFTVQDGKVIEAREHLDNTAKADEFWY